MSFTGDRLDSCGHISWIDFPGLRVRNNDWNLIGRNVVFAPWSREDVPRGDQVYDRDHNEYDVPVKWLAVLDEEGIVSPTEIRQITGRKTPQRTLETPNNECQEGMKCLAEIIVGRTVLDDLL